MGVLSIVLYPGALCYEVFTNVEVVSNSAVVSTAFSAVPLKKIPLPARHGGIPSEDCPLRRSATPPWDRRALHGALEDNRPPARRPRAPRARTERAGRRRRTSSRQR